VYEKCFDNTPSKRKTIYSLGSRKTHSVALPAEKCFPISGIKYIKIIKILLIIIIFIYRVWKTIIGVIWREAKWEFAPV